MQTMTFIVPRTSSDETTLATVHATLDEQETMGEFQDRLMKAVTKWVRESDEGAQAWKNSMFDFNVGDLSNYTDNYILKGFLKEQGIHEIKISTASSDCKGTWEFDDLLVDTNELNPEDEDG